ncbi:MAG: hypothetical protein HQL27_07480 [Candidatus Omnitrophica bacterium]|nr:hypothetical protein [Candidatus Omnitrophota bacterium]
MKEFKRTSTKQLGELLIERGVITREQLNLSLEYKEKNGCMIGEALVELNFATERDIAQALTCQYGFPYLPLLNYEIDKDIAASLSGDVCRKYTLIPIDKIGKNITLAMANPLNTQAIEEVEKITGCTVQIFVSTATEVKQVISNYYK